MSHHYCSNCGGYCPPFLEHKCKPIGEKRLREIIREETAERGTPMTTNDPQPNEPNWVEWVTTPNDRLPEIQGLATERPYRGDPNITWLIAELVAVRAERDALAETNALNIDARKTILADLRAARAELGRYREALQAAAKDFHDIAIMAETATIDEPVWALPGRVKWAAVGAQKAIEHALASTKVLW